MGRTTEHAIHPDPTLMEDIGATSFTVAEALIELVANSMDAKVDGEKLQIDIFVDPEEIRVIDDASGMDRDILAQAVRLGVKMDKIQKNKRTRKGMFGLGMKTACASLGQYWSVATRPSDGDQEFSLEFDLTEWTARAGDTDFEWKIEIEEKDPDQDGVLGRREHGTAIIIRDLRDYNPMAGPVLEKLGRAYKGHLESGDIIRVNGEDARPPQYEFIEGSDVEIDTTCGGNDDYRIHGWVALDKKTHNDDYFGLNLYREGQLIEAWNKDWFSVHLMTSRIIGEIHLDFVPPNFHKKGFERQSPEWKMASKEMKEVLKPVVKASRQASRGKDPKKFRKAAQGLQKAMGKSSAVAKLADPPAEDGGQPADGGSGNGAGKSDNGGIEVAARTLVFQNQKIHLTYEMEELPDDQMPWDYIYDDEEHELQAIVNTGSRLFQKSKDNEFLGTLALADCVAAFLIDELGYGSADARRIRNRWLYKTIGE